VLQFAIAVLLTVIIIKLDRYAKRSIESQTETKAAFKPIEFEKKKEIYDQIVFVRSKTHSLASEISVPIKLQNVVGLELYQASVPQGQHTIASDESITVVAGGTVVFTVSAGTHTLTTLVSAFNAASTTASANLTMSYSTTTFLITITHSSATFVLTISETLSDILGIPESSTSSTGAPYVVVGTNRANLYGPHLCTVKVKELSRLGASDNILARVPLTDNLTFFHPDSPLHRPFPHPTYVDYLTIRMEDFDTGGLLDFNGLEYTLTLIFKIVRYKILSHDEVLRTS